MPLPNRTTDLPEKRYYDPSTEENWADILHSVLEELSVNALVSGTDHTQYDPKDGQLFVHTDGGRWYIGDGSSWIDLGEVGSAGGNFEGSLTRVTTADQLTTALGETHYIRIDGPLDVSAVSPVEVPADTCLFGSGSYRDTSTDGMAQSAKLFDNSANPTLRVVGDDARLFGFAVNNQSQDTNASAIVTEAHETDISSVDVFCGHDGIVARSPGDGEPSGTQVHNCRVYSQTGVAGSGVGIRIDGQHEVEASENAVGGFNTQIEATSDDANIHNNHTHDGGATAIDVGIRVSGTRARVTNNRCEGAPETAGIHLTAPGYRIVTNNLIQTGAGADGIFLDFADDLYLTVIQHNLIRLHYNASSTGNLPINGNQITGQWRSSVTSNSYSGFSGHGYTTETVSAGTNIQPNHDEIQRGELVLNEDDGSIWTNLGYSVHQLNRVDGWEALDVVEDPDSGTSLDVSIDSDPAYGTYLLAGYINGGATSSNAENTEIDININSNYNSIYDHYQLEGSTGLAYTTGATGWAEQVWSRGVTPIAWRIHSGTEVGPSDADTPWTTIHSVSHQGRRGLLSGRADRADRRLHSIQLYSEVPRFGGRFVLYGIDRDRVAL